MKHPFIRKYMLNHKKDVFFICLFIVFFLISQLSQPFIIGNMLDNALKGNKEIFIGELIVLASLSVLGIFSNFIFEYLSGSLTQKVIYQVRQDIFDKYNAVSIETMNRAILKVSNKITSAPSLTA